MSEHATVIVGTKFQGKAALQALARMKPGETARLERVLDNPHDPNAVSVYYLGVMVGWIPRQANPPIARAFDRSSAVTATCTVAAVMAPGGWKVNVEPKLRVEITDF